MGPTLERGEGPLRTEVDIDFVCLCPQIIQLNSIEYITLSISLICIRFCVHNRGREIPTAECSKFERQNHKMGLHSYVHGLTTSVLNIYFRMHKAKVIVI